MRYLLDVNALLALIHEGHMHHTIAKKWFLNLKNPVLALCPITELGFLRISVQAKLLKDVNEARLVLREFKQNKVVDFWADAVDEKKFPGYIKTPNQLTDGHLLAVAHSHNAKLATFDQGIPTATLIK